MKVQIQKWGNSLALRISKSFAIETNIQQGTIVDVSVRGDTIVLRPARDDLALSELLANVTPENIHSEIDFGMPRGNEIW
jgi:antitoxin MazE